MNFKKVNSFCFFIFLFTLNASSAIASLSIARVVLMKGEVTTQKGKILFTEWNPGDLLRTNPFSQYRGSRNQTSSKLEFSVGSKPEALEIGKEIELNSIIKTGDAAWIRFLFSDNSIIDLGPNTVISVVQYDMTHQLRNIKFKLFNGRARILVTKKLEGRSTYQISAPGVLTSVRGTDFAVHVAQPKAEGRVDTWVLGIRGQITSDVVKIGTDPVKPFTDDQHRGETYFQSYIVNTYSLLKVSSADGFALTTNLEDHLSASDYSQALDHHTPLTDPILSPLGKAPMASELPGTGILRSDRMRAPQEEEQVDKQTDLEKEHPRYGSAALEKSGNFFAPPELERDPEQVNSRLRLWEHFLGHDQVNRLPYGALQAASPGLAPLKN